MDFFKEVKESPEEMPGVVRARGSLRVILQAQEWQIAMPHALHGPIVEILVRHLNPLARDGVDPHREVMVLRGDLDLTGREILNRVIPAMMSEL